MQGTEHLEYTCRHCGKVTDLTRFDLQGEWAKYMWQKRLCFHCAYWDKFINTPDRYEIVNGRIYEYGTPIFIVNTKSGRVRTRYIVHPDHSIKRIHFSRFTEKVPKDWNIPNTGYIVSYETFRKISKRRNFQCRAIGCYDRYHCFFYNAEKMEPDGPWNEIPKTHKIGSEHCQSFINKDDIFTNNNTNEQ